MTSLQQKEEDHEFDSTGWAHVHHAAFNGYQKSVIRFVKTRSDRLEVLTQDGLQLTPLLVACMSGKQETVEVLVELGANLKATDSKLRNVVMIALLNRKLHLLKYFSDLQREELKVLPSVYHCFSGSFGQELEEAASSALAMLSLDENYCQQIYDSDGPQLLIKVLKSSFASLTCRELCLDTLLNLANSFNLGDHFVKFSGVATLLDQLQYDSIAVSLKSVKLLGIIAHENHDIKNLIEAVAGLGKLIKVVDKYQDTDRTDMIKECLETLTIALSGHSMLQNNFASHDNGFQVIINLMNTLLVNTSKNIDILGRTTKLISVVVQNNTSSQNDFIASGGIDPLLKLLKTKFVKGITNGIEAIENLAIDNKQNQKIFSEKGAVTLLIKALKRTRHSDTRAAIIAALWAIAGQNFHQKRAVSCLIGVNLAVEFLSSSMPERLHYFGSEALKIVAVGVNNEINDIAEAGGVQSILHILGNGVTSTEVICSLLITLRTLCVTPGYSPHVVNQKTAASEGAIKLLYHFSQTPEEMEQAEAIYTLGSVVFLNKENHALLRLTDFKYLDVMKLICSKNEAVKIRGGAALALFVFNSTKQQKQMALCGGIPYQYFVPFLQSGSERSVASAAFQVVVLSQIICDETPAISSAAGIKSLFDLLDSSDEEIQTEAANCVAGLAKMKYGVPDAIISIGTILSLCKLLKSSFDIVQAAAAAALWKSQL